MSPANEIPTWGSARADPRVAEALYRMALKGDRWAAATTIVGALFVLSVVEQQHISSAPWMWCAACVVLAGVRLVVFRAPREAAASDEPPALKYWLTILFLTYAAWGAGPALIVLRHPSADTLLTGIFLAAAGVSAPLAAASRPAIYLSLLPSLLPLLLTFILGAALGKLDFSISLVLLASLAAACLLLLLRLALMQNKTLTMLLGVRIHNEDLVLQLRSQIEVAARANEEKTRFLASAAHDLRQPLHALGMFCAALDQRLKNTPDKPLVRNMMTAIESLEVSFGAMLDISRLDAGIVKAVPQSFPIRDVFRRLYQQFGGDAEARNISLRFRAARRIVRSDPLLLERVLANLAQNALRYTRNGGVLLAARRHPRGVALEVWDTGVGIPEDKREMIFREFYQIENPERDRSRGLGMGLAIVQRLCRLLEHPLELSSVVGRGSMFRVVVPAGDASAIDTPAAEADTLPPRKIGTVTVLLVEDDPAIREATRELLKPLHVDVLTAGSIAEAVAMATNRRDGIDMILSDWRLHGQENGIDAIRAIRAVAGEATPAMLITGETSPDLLKVAHESGLLVMHKPLQPRVLVRLVKHLRR